MTNLCYAVFHSSLWTSVQKPSCPKILLGLSTMVGIAWGRVALRLISHADSTEREQKAALRDAAYSGSLSLSNKQLSVVPDDVWTQDLSKLSLSHNTLTTLHESVGALGHLTCLDVSYNKLVSQFYANLSMFLLKNNLEHTARKSFEMCGTNRAGPILQQTEFTLSFSLRALQVAHTQGKWQLSHHSP